MSWDYAALSRNAKLLGGPEKYIKYLKHIGRREMIPVAIVMCFLGGGVGYNVRPLCERIKTKKAERKKADKNVQEEFIKKIDALDEQRKNTIN